MTSFNDLVINIHLVDSGRDNPSNIPLAMAITFLIAPYISVPNISLVGTNFKYLFCNAFIINFSVALFLVARVRPIGTWVTISMAKVPPEITAIFFVFMALFTMLLTNNRLPCSIPLLAIHICWLFFMIGVSCETTLLTNLTGIAITIKLDPLIASCISVVNLMFLFTLKLGRTLLLVLSFSNSFFSSSRIVHMVISQLFKLNISDSASPYAPQPKIVIFIIPPFLWYREF